MQTKQGQSFWDLVIQGTGDVDNAFKMALKNGISVTDDVAIGDEIEITEVTSKKIVAQFNANNYPATKEPFPNSGVNSPILGGIGYMQIENTFKVS